MIGLIAKKWRESPILRTVTGMTGGNLLATAVGLVGSLVQARYIGPEDLGYFRQFAIFTAYATFLHLGLSGALQRFYPLFTGQGQRDKAEAAAQICQSWVVSVSVLVSGAFLLLSLVAFGRGNWRAGLAWMVQAISFVSFTYGGYLAATYRSGHDFMTVAKGTVLGSVTNLFTLPCFLFFPYIALTLRSCVGSISSLIYLHRRRPLHLRWRFNWREWFTAVKHGILLFTASYGVSAGWSAVEASLIVTLLDTASLGLWSVSLMFMAIVNKAAQAITAVYVPRIIEEYGRTGSAEACLRMCRRPMLWGLLLVSLMGLGACVVMSMVVPWLMPRYTAAIPTMCLMMIYLPMIILKMPCTLILAKGAVVWMNLFTYTSLGIFALLALLAVRAGLGLNGIAGAMLMSRAAGLAMNYLFIGVTVRSERLAKGNVT